MNLTYALMDIQVIELLLTKCLGVQVAETLLWEAPISEVVGEVAKLLAALRRLRPLCP